MMNKLKSTRQTPNAVQSEKAIAARVPVELWERFTRTVLGNGRVVKTELAEALRMYLAVTKRQSV